MGIKKVLYSTFVITNLAVALYFAVYTFVNSLNGLLDFPVFYGAAQNALHGLSIYTYYGTYHFPFWYFPWTSWLFLPLAFFSSQVAAIIFFVIGLGIAFLSINALANQYPRFSFFDRLFMFSMLLWMSWLAIRVGQMSFLILGTTVLVILSLARGRSILPGLLMPLLLIKPHLFIIFIPLVLWLGGKKTFIAGALFTLLLLGVEFVITPHWVGQMLNLLVEGTRRVESDPFWNFSTLPTLLGFSQNYTGTANLPISIFLMAIAAFVTVRFRALPKIPILSLALAASLFCAPRSYAYDLVLLIPAMLWLSENWSFKTALLWAICAIIPFFARFSAGSYLVTLIVFGLSVYKAFSTERHIGIKRSFFGRRMDPA
jgi:hypothetical protein